MNIYIDHHKNAGCSYHRVYQPIVEMTNITDSPYVGHRNQRLLSASDSVFLFNRVPLGDSDDVRVMKNREVKIVVDIDDHWILYPHHEMASSWAKSKAHEQIYEYMQLADMVLTTNERLKVAASHVNSNVHVVPNGLRFDRDQFNDRSPSWPSDKKVRFIYTGGTSHLHDLSILKPVMKRLNSDPQFRQSGEIVLAGYQHEYGVGNTSGPWAKMLNIIKQSGSWSVLPHQELGRYMTSYNVADVALAPLEDITFNMCKSNLKTLEAGCKNIPIIASNMEPYTQDRECPGVILCSTPKEWYEAMKMLMNDRSLRESLGRQLGGYVREKYPMSKFAQQRIELFKTL